MKMVAVKVSEADGRILDWMVALADGHKPPLLRILRGSVALADIKDPMWCDYLEYTTDWSQGGPIIDRERIHIRPTFTQGGYRTSQSVDAVHATIELPNSATVFEADKVIWEYGPTMLIAAMRCFVVSKLGNEVEVPEELLSKF